MKNVLVTGANGFIGSWLINKLAENRINVYAVIRNEQSNKTNINNSEYVHYYYFEMQNILEIEKSLINVKIDTFYHLAWEGVGGEKRSDYNIQLYNVKGACDLMLLASKLGCEKFLCAGTISEKIAENIISMETMAENTIYAIAKSTARSMLKVLSRKYNIEFIWMRMANTYGPNNSCGNIVNYIIEEFKKNKSPELTKGEQPYDLIYVENLVQAMYLLGDKKVDKDLYYIGSGENKTLKEFVLKIRDSYPNNVEVNLGARPEDGLVYKEEWFEIDDLIKDTGYTPKYSLEEGIAKTLKDFMEDL